MNKVLCLAPHTDDAEIGCGGTIARFLREGKDVYVLVFSKALATKQSFIPKMATGEVYNEFRAAMKELGVPNENLFIYQFPTRYLYSMRQDVLEKMIEIREKVNPDLVLLPGTNDFHQDHQVISKEGIRAFKNKTLLGYEFAWNVLTSNSNSFFKLEESDIKKKIKAILKYKSQKFRPYMNKDYIVHNAELNGLRIGEKYAESFEIIRLIQ